MWVKGGAVQGFDMCGLHITNWEFVPSLAEGFPVLLHFVLSQGRDKSEGTIISDSKPEWKFGMAALVRGMGSIMLVWLVTGDVNNLDHSIKVV